MCERHYGAEWYWNPKRWTTADGYVPWAEFLVKWDALMGHLAIDRLQQTLAAFTGRAEGDQAQRALDRMERAAFPES